MSFLPPLSFLRPLSFLPPLSFLRKQESISPASLDPWSSQG